MDKNSRDNCGSSLLRIASGSTVATGAGFTFIAGTGTVEYYRMVLKR
jgi:hypothetical protein